MSKQARAVDLPHEGFGSYFLDVFDRPPRVVAAASAPASGGASLSQVLLLANSAEIENKIAAGNGRVAKLVKEKTTPERPIEELYLAAFAASPDGGEQEQDAGLPGQARRTSSGGWKTCCGRC